MGCSSCSFAIVLARNKIASATSIVSPDQRPLPLLQKNTPPLVLIKVGHKFHLYVQTYLYSTLYDLPLFLSTPSLHFFSKFQSIHDIFFITMRRL